MRARRVLRDGERARVVVTRFVARPRATTAARALASARRRELGVAPAVRPRIEYYDLATNPVIDVDSGGVTQNEWREETMEGPPFPSIDAYGRVAERLTSRVGDRFELERSRELVDRHYRLQVDAQTTGTGAVALVEGETGRRALALATGSRFWRAPASDVDQLASIEALRQRRREGGGDKGKGRGLGDWAAKLAARSSARYGEYARGRVGREGLLEVPVAEGSYTLGLGSYDTWEQWLAGDRGRYKVTSAPVYEAPAVEPPRLHASRSAASRVRAYLVPQTWRVVFQWLTIYEVTVGWFGQEIRVPTTRAITLRAPFWPRYHVPEGAPDPSSPLAVGDLMSVRISRTRAYAAAIVSDTRFAIESLFFRLAARVQGRYACYLRDPEAGALCAVLIFTDPDGSERRYYVWRTATIDLGLTPEQRRLEVSGLATQEVTPWVPGVYVGYDSPVTVGI